ncbi:TRAP transporter substrate-binding protein [Desulfobacula sp.]|uniref:TRAP transporter substrate-binding protein n=1 Tax=Desulfobacula sp. TaxID=2593537 RepID=UPI002618447D|nr:TRAP transporter substrate-binding protein [Desulfobacula sp.]
MNRRYPFFISFLTGLLVLFFCGPLAAKTITFKFSNFVPPIEAHAKAGVWIEKELNETAGDKVKAKYFHSGQMGGPPDIVKKTQMGVLQGAWLIGNIAPDFNSKFAIGTLAYLMDSYEKWNAFLENDALREELFSSLEPKGLKVLDLCYFGKYGITSTKPARTLNDLKKMKLRTTKGKYPLAFWNAIDVNPTPMSWGDVIPALNQKVIDGTDQTMGVVYLLKVDDLCKYFTRTNHMIGLHFFVVNNKWYKKLDPEVSEVIAASVHKNFKKAREMAMELTAKAEAELPKKGVEIIDFSKEDLNALKEAQKTVWKKFETEIGKEWLDKVSNFVSGM